MRSSRKNYVWCLFAVCVVVIVRCVLSVVVVLCVFLCAAVYVCVEYESMRLDAFMLCAVHVIRPMPVLGLYICCFSINTTIYWSLLLSCFSIIMSPLFFFRKFGNGTSDYLNNNIWLQQVEFEKFRSLGCLILKNTVCLESGLFKLVLTRIFALCSFVCCTFGAFELVVCLFVWYGIYSVMMFF